MSHKNLLFLVTVPEHALTCYLLLSYNVYGIGYVIKHTTMLCLKRLTFRSPVDSGHVVQKCCSFSRDQGSGHGSGQRLRRWPAAGQPSLLPPACPLLSGHTLLRSQRPAFRCCKRNAPAVPAGPRLPT